ncbi:hypothetical protein ACFSO7_08585 [Bacillus sp. CGMCC 1.16607]|uniref:hypothetical protein n=1 Tax=Bacillus sp. CGMCC 1.16607 TaxID=3351842 RepID=UPI00363180C3
MKNSTQKMLLFLTIVLIALCSFFIIRWNLEKNQSNHLNSVIDQIVLRNFTSLTSDLNDIADTLSEYDEGLTEQDMDIFTHSLNKDYRTLNETGTSLSFLLNDKSLNDSLIYEDYIWKIEKVTLEIIEGKINDENKIHSIGNVIKKYNDQLKDMFYGEKQVGVEGINTIKEIKKVMEIIDEMNNKIGEILNK